MSTPPQPGPRAAATTDVSAPSRPGEDTTAGYAGLYAPVDGAFEQIARMAALVLNAAIVTVTIAGDARIWFPPSEGPDDGGLLPAGPSVSTRVDTLKPWAIGDVSADPQTKDHPWAQGKHSIRFFAAAPILIPDGRRVGTLEVMDRRRRRRATTTPTQLALLAGLAATIAQLLHLRINALNVLRTERSNHVADTLARDAADQLSAQATRAAADVVQRQRPDWCQLGGTRACTERAELKVADSWGEGAWGCWQHTEDALIQIPSVFLATESIPNLSTYRARNTA